jgi:precorrin-8X/cobalt-precorrin-8 methylmutase
MTDPPSSNSLPLVQRYSLPPRDTEERSLDIVRQSHEGGYRDEQERTVATRILYAAGDLNLAAALRFSPGAIDAGIDALRSGASIVTDVRMVLAGLDRPRAQGLGCPIYCAIDDPSAAQLSRLNGTTRAVEAIRLSAARLNGGIAVIGNAPTALLCLLDLIDAGVTRPGMIVGMPVGFIAAAESKAELVNRDVPYVTIEGSRGGSALAAAAVNALLRLAAPTTTGSAARSHTAVIFAGHGSRALDAAEAMLASIENVRARGLFPIVESGYLELCPPDLPTALKTCVEQGATRVLVVPYFLNNGVHIRRDIPNVIRLAAASYPGLSISIGRPIGLHADLANVMIAGALEAEDMPDLTAMLEESPIEDGRSRR